MASRFMPSRRTGFALIAGFLLFSALAAATARPGDLSVGEIEEQLQVIHQRAELVHHFWPLIAEVDTLPLELPSGRSS